jgi:hypothetical protein
MSETNETTNEVPEVPAYPTAFLMIKDVDGTWRVTTDLNTQFKADYQATRLDIRIGCQEIANIIHQQDIAANVVTLLVQNFSTDTQREGAPTSDDSSELK